MDERLIKKTKKIINITSFQPKKRINVENENKL